MPLDTAFARFTSEGRGDVGAAQMTPKTMRTKEKTLMTLTRHARLSKRMRKAWAIPKEAEMALRAPEKLTTNSEVSKSWPGP